MSLLAYSTATQLTAVVAAFLLLLALIGFVRSLFSRSNARRFRVGVFVERDELEPSSPPEPGGDAVAAPASEAATKVDWPKAPA